jgi:hypothetical protein
MLLLYYNWAQGCSTCKSESTNHHCIIYQKESLSYHKSSRSMSTLTSTFSNQQQNNMFHVQG